MCSGFTAKIIFSSYANYLILLSRWVGSKKDSSRNIIVRVFIRLSGEEGRYFVWWSKSRMPRPPKIISCGGQHVMSSDGC